MITHGSLVPQTTTRNGVERSWRTPMLLLTELRDGS